MFTFYSLSTDPERITVVGEHKEGVLKLAVSKCSLKDRFVRKKGRLIATGRLAKGITFATVAMENCDVKTFVAVAMEVIDKVQEFSTLRKKLNPKN